MKQDTYEEETYIWRLSMCWCPPPPAYMWCPFYFPHPRPSNILRPPLDTYKVCISVVCRNTQWPPRRDCRTFSQSLINHKLTINWPTTTLVSTGVQIAIRAIKHEVEAEMWGGRRPGRETQRDAGPPVCVDCSNSNGDRWRWPRTARSSKERRRAGGNERKR